MKKSNTRLVAAVLLLTCTAIFQTGNNTSISEQSIEAPLCLQDEVKQLITTQPGQYFRNTIRETNRSIGVIQYHVSRLLNKGAIVSFTVANYKGFFPVAMQHLSEKKKSALVFLYVPKKGEILRALVANEKIMQNELSDKLDISVQNLSYHLKSLEELGIIERERVGLTKLITLADDLIPILDQYC